jgi:hypothetical protein
VHLYIAVNCKTQDCRTVHVLMHLGEEGKTPAKVEYWMSYPLIVDCPSCGTTYDYSDVEEKFLQKEHPAPRWDIRTGSPRPRFRTHFLQKKPDEFREPSSRPSHA